MKHINTIVNARLLTNAVEVKLNISEEAINIVDNLFRVLETHIKYFKLNTQNQNELDFKKREWVKTFATCGISKERVEMGVKRLRRDGDCFATITPNEFLKYCTITPEEIGAPSIHDAYLIACKMSNPCETTKDFKHEAVRYAFNATGSYFLRTESKAHTMRIFEKNYALACELFFDGKIMNQLEFDNDPQGNETLRQQEIIAKGYKKYNSHKKSVSFLRSILV